MMVGAADPPDPERSRTVTPLPHYLRTFQHLAPAKERPVRRRRGRGRTWAAVSVLGLLALTLMRRPTPEAPPVTAAAKRPDAPRIALAPSPRPAPTDAPAPRVVERQGPTLIEKLLANKFGTPLPTPAPPQAVPPQQPEQLLAAAPKPAPPPTPRPAADPSADRPGVIAALPAQLTSRLTDPARSASEAATKPAPEKPKLAAKPEPTKPQVAAKPEPAASKPQVAAKPEPTAPKPQVVAAAEPAIQRQTAAKAEPPPPAAVRVQERPIEVARVEAAQPAERVERVVAAPAPPVVVASVPRAEPANTAAAGSAAADVERIAAVRTPPPNPPGPSHDAVRVLLDRYAAAWRGHDVDTLRAIGQVTSDGQASALRAYFANVGDLEVEVRVLDIRSDGDRATVRFTRRDRFRDPAGREIAKESPPIEKNVVITPQGLRFAPSS